MPATPSHANASQASKSWIRALTQAKILQDAPGTTLVSLYDQLAEIHHDNPALLDADHRLTYKDLAARANQYARWTMAQGLIPNQVVCLLLPNCPDYVAIWLGITRIGCTVALINTNLTSDALLQCIAASGSTHLIVADTLSAAVLSIADRLPPNTQVHTWPMIEPQVAGQGTTALETTQQPFPHPSACALLIYTSGTTGLPKAVNITHRRIAEWSFWFAGMMDVQPADRLYNCLPMYHSIGGIVAIGAMLVNGGSVFIRQRFSATRFWDDVIDADCTIFQYIGELCRYLIESPPASPPRRHRLRLACGNGLQASVWEIFKNRFQIPHILEFYAATEGIVSLYNCEGKSGAIGRIPAFLAHRFPIALIRCDIETQTPQRDAAGRCIPCAPNEPGEAIGKLSDNPRMPIQHFDGYTDQAASARKILHDVFAPGDRWYRTGDLLRKDEAGYFYFVDRMGDTFRWRGENVSTTQVAEVLRSCNGVTDAVVYGVTIPGHEGRAGMAAITVDSNFDIAILSEHLSANLPAYAHPLFLRYCHTLDVTTTFKLVKENLAREGYAHTSGPVWFNDRTAGHYRLADADLLRSINDGTRRL